MLSFFGLKAEKTNKDYKQHHDGLRFPFIFVFVVILTHIEAENKQNNQLDGRQ